MKRWTLRICVFLLLGAIVNVAVAWVLAFQITKWWTMAYIGLVPLPGSPPALEVITHSKPGAMNIEAQASLIAGRTVIPPLPVWSRAGTLTVADLEKRTRIMEYARGWPFISLYCRRIDQPGVPSRIEAGLPTRLNSETVLPLAPIWPGFAINTLFYAGILWLLFAAPFALRRRRRIKRGLCPACAYPVGDSEVCTECGKPVAVQSGKLAA